MKWTVVLNADLVLLRQNVNDRVEKIGRGVEIVPV